MSDPSRSRVDPAEWTAASSSGLVACAHHIAADIGAGVLADGGNAVDAAIATSLALGVVEPAGSGLGGMAIATIYWADDGKATAFPGACRAPGSARPEEVAASARYTGHRSIAVPTNVALLDTIHRRFGSLPIETLVAPSRELAEQGFTITPGLARLTETYASALHSHSGGKVFLQTDGSPLRAGDTLRQPALAETLSRLATEGLQDFYRGGIARAVVEDSQANGGFLTRKDLEDVDDIEVVEPVVGSFRNRSYFCPGTPAGGRTLAEMLHLVDEMVPEPLDFSDPEHVRLLAAIIRRARSDRRRYRYQDSTEPDLSSRTYAAGAARELQRELAGSDTHNSEGGETSHICVVDSHGNAVSMTQSIERSFGSKVLTPRLGFLYNGYMKGFKVRDTRHPHFLKPGALARSNAAPAIGVDDTGVCVVVGSTGSERMLSGILSTLLRLESQSPFEAVAGARLHATPDDEVLIEADGFHSPCLERLENGGFTVNRLERYSFKFGGLQLICVEGSEYVGVADPRRDGACRAARGNDAF